MNVHLGNKSSILESDMSLPLQLGKRLKEENRPLRIEILDCSGGRGHKKSADAVQRAVQQHFGNRVEIQRKDVGSNLVREPFGKVNIGKHNMIDVYNYLLRNGKTRIINLLTRIGIVLHRLYSCYNVKYFARHYRKKEKKGTLPDLVISAVPFVNGPLLKAVKSKNIPTLVVSTDADNSLFSVNWPKDKDFAPYRYCIPYNSFEIANKVNKAVDPKKIRGIGYPVRKEFLQDYTHEQLEGFREELGLDEGKKIIGVMMGGLGGIVTKKYFRALLQAIQRKTLDETNAHFTFFCGTNRKMGRELLKKAKTGGFQLLVDAKGEGKKLQHPSGVSISIVDKISTKVHKHMAVADAWVSKSGSSTFNECLCMGVPMLLDHTGTAVLWENLNFELAKTYHFGRSVNSVSQFIPLVNEILKKENNEEYRLAMINYRKERPFQKDFGKNVVHLSYELLESAENLRQSEDAKKELRSIKKTRGNIFLHKMKSLGLKLARSAKKVYEIVISILFFPFILFGKAIKRGFERLVSHAYFSGFSMNCHLKKKRRKDLMQGIRCLKNGQVIKTLHIGKPIEGKIAPLFSKVTNRPIDALYIKSGAEKRTSSAIIFILAKEYQNFHPKNFDHLLDDGADVIFFNPTETSAVAMASDLKTLIQELKRNNPEQKLALHGYSMGAHVGVAVAADIADGKVEGVKESIPMIVDRGFASGYKIAKKISLLAKLPFAKKYIKRHYSLKSAKNIEKHKGSMLFLTPKDGSDLIAHRRKRGKGFHNYTRDLFNKHQNVGDKLVVLERADHWTPWTYKVQNEVKKFLSKENIIQEDYKIFDKLHTGGFPKKTYVPWQRRRLLPLFI